MRVLSFSWYYPGNQNHASNEIIGNGSGGSIRDIEISANIGTLDNIRFTEAELKRIEAFCDKYGLGKSDGCKPAYNTWDILNPSEKDSLNPSYKRVYSLLSDPDMEPYFSSKSRKKVFLSESYWRLKQNRCKQIVFPDERQYSFAILKIKAKFIDNGELIVNQVDEPGPYGSIRRASEGEQYLNLDLAGDENFMKVLVFEGEILKFQTKKHLWRIDLKHIVNPGSWRGGQDMVVVDWSVD